MRHECDYDYDYDYQSGKTAQQPNADLQLCPAANINTKIKLLKQLTTTYTEMRNSITPTKYTTNNKQRNSCKELK